MGKHRTMTTSTPSVLPARERLAAAIASSELPVYVYSYPPKRAYRPLAADLSLERIWSGATGPLNLYIHVPFCGYRCSFCTLFLTTSHEAETRQRYVEAVQRQIAMYGRLLGHLEVESLYVGGGTPTVLEASQFEELFTSLRAAFPTWRADAEIAVEGSPDTMRRELLAPLKDLGVNRISMGLQTLDPEEARRVGRRYDLDTVHRAVEAINRVRFENVNYDLIYGLEGQTRESWFRSLGATLDFGPRTVTLYPIVVRPLTAIQKQRDLREDRFLENESKYALYDETVEYLDGRRFRQNSFVRFSQMEIDGLRQEVSDFAGNPVLGLGAGSRSYAAETHYGTDFAVRRRAAEDIITGFIGHDHRPESVPGLGFILNLDERKRRHAILNLSLGHLDPRGYRERFASELTADFGEETEALLAEECVARDESGSFRLTRKGFKYSNMIATLFESPDVVRLDAAYIPT